MVLSKRQKAANVVIHILLILLTVIMVAPFVLLFMASVTDEMTLLQDGYAFWPGKFSLEAYRYMINSGQAIVRAYGMTFAITIVGTVLNLLLSSMLAYGLSLNGLPGKKIFAFYVFFTMLFNGGLVPTYLM